MKRTRGIALVAALILLLALTLLAVTSMKMMTDQERISSNHQVKLQSFQTADSSLQFGENWINRQLTWPEIDAFANCTTPTCLIWSTNAALNFDALADSWWLAQGRIPTYSAILPRSLSSNRNRFVIEELQFLSDDLDPNAASLGHGIVYYRVTSWGLADDGAKSLLQSIYAQRY
jgi:type IV pilus assembly protein PilX